MVYVISACHNREKLTEQFAKSIAEQSYKNCHLILVDDGSTDNTIKYVKSQINNLTVIKGNGNLWWGGAMQKAYKWVRMNLKDKRNDYILITNDDVQYPKNYIETGVDFLNTVKNGLVLGEGYDIKSGKLLDTVYHVDYKCSWRQPSVVKSHDHVGECCSTRSIFMDVDTYLKIGGFHPILLPHYGSDTEWTMRAAKKGYKIYTFDDLQYSFDAGATGANEYETLTLKKLFSKSSNINPFYRMNWVILSTPLRYLPKEIGCQLLRYVSKIKIIVKIIKNHY